MKLGTETGSMMNHLMVNANHPKPVVGMGATMCSWSDRTAATIVAVTPKTITVKCDKATRTDKNGMSDCQTYSYTPDPNEEP